MNESPSRSLLKNQIHNVLDTEVYTAFASKYENSVEAQIGRLSKHELMPMIYHDVLLLSKIIEELRNNFVDKPV